VTLARRGRAARPVPVLNKSPTVVSSAWASAKATRSDGSVTPDSMAETASREIGPAA
jgi:hypothetical protein